MPYRRAHWWIVALLVITGFAFWRDYLAVLPESPWAWHLHGVTATLWMIFVGLQSWTAVTRRFPLHRVIGRASLGLFPLFFTGGIAVVHRMASLTPGDLFYKLHGYGLGFVDLAASLTIGWLFYSALRERRSVQFHARYMLATPLLLMMPAFGRIGTHFVPGLVIHGPTDFGLFTYSLHLSNLLTAAVALWLYRTAPRYGRPFLVVAIVGLAQSLGFALLPHLAPWRDGFSAFGRLPVAPVLVAALAIGAAVTWLGWNAGSKPARPAKPALAPAI